MKKQIREAGRGETQKRGRKGARKCPCCGCAPCSCEASCFCQELKRGAADDDAEEEGFGDDLRFSFLKYAEQGL